MELSRTAVPVKQVVEGEKPDPEDLAAQVPKEIKLSMVVKTDVSGSEEAIVNAISMLPQSKCRCEILKSGLGAVTDSDLDTASEFGGKSSCERV